MLTLWRRHTDTCPHRDKGREHDKCTCPFWCDGEIKGKRIRKSLKTRDRQRAIRNADSIENDTAPSKPLKDAIAAFENHILPLEASTRRKYQNVLDQIKNFCDGKARDIDEVTVEHLDAYRAAREISVATFMKELQILRQFFGFCSERKWIDDNPAKRMKLPRNIKPGPVVPYTPAEVGRMISACGEVGHSNYERLRARAMVLLLRYTGLRISDVATLSRDRVTPGRILLYTHKTGAHVFLPIGVELQAALASLPHPRGAGSNPEYYFWNGEMLKQTVVDIAARTLAAVFKRSKVPGAHAHRFRHTLATELLARGGSEQEVADILGISPVVVRKHYAKWSHGRQERISTLFEAVYPGTFLAHEENVSVTH
ncbi:MAG: tyrosine-type recombinase/integrase [Acidobacteriia bacterium]|nr:tyrosine-type recombinase/integrase [Terriglobia bacterium]